MSALSTRVEELRQLLRLRRMHEEAARGRHQACAAALDASQACVAACRARLAGIVEQRAGLAVWFGAGQSVGSYQAYANAHRDLLDEAQDEAECRLIDEQRAVSQAERALMEAKDAWGRAGARLQAVEQLLGRTRVQQAREAERRIERNADMPLRGRSPHPAMAGREEGRA
jgi:hypothetical protein